MDPALAQRLLAVSPQVEQGIAAAVVVAALLLVARSARSRRRGGAARPACSKLARRAEAAWLMLVVATALFLRIVGYTDPQEPRWWFSATTTLWAAEALARGDLANQWVHLLRNTQAQSLEQSAVMMPVSTAFQAVLGPSFHLPQLVGVFWGVLAVILAWLSGRAIVSPAFGLAFAAFLACTPLQVAWSRLGFMPIGAGAQVLFVVWLAYRAGSRRSAAIALLAAACAGATIYGYQAARIAVPLGAVALLAGLRAASATRRDYARVAATLAVAAGITLGAFGPDSARKALWPYYRAYVGARGEASARQFLHSAAEALRTEAPTALRSYFWVGRLTNRGAIDENDWGMASGGLCLLPVGALGLVGLAVAASKWKRTYPWLVFTALGLALPCLSAPTARRFLLFDTAWCALAAFGLLAIIESRWLAGLSRRCLGATTGALFLLLAMWTGATLTALKANLASDPYTEIPFGESGHWDGRVCLGCVHAGQRWQREIGGNNLVVLFDSEPDREQRGIPAGLSLFGKLGALAAGKPGHFIDFYAVAQNFDIEPPTVRNVFDPLQTSFASFLTDRVDAAEAAEIVWHFERPTQWERAVARRLRALGGVRTTLDRPSLAMFTTTTDRPTEVRLPWARRREAVALLLRLSGAVQPARPQCIGLHRVGVERFTRQALVLGALPSATAPPRWAIGTFAGVEYGGRAFPALEPFALAASSPRASAQGLYVLNHAGGYDLRDPSTGSVTQGSALAPVRRNCAVLVGDEWWIVDPAAGTLAVPARRDRPSPAGPWVGIAASDSVGVVLASPEQSLTVVDAGSLAARHTFPAVVPPSRRYHFGECSRVVAGGSWVGTFNQLVARLVVYDPDGTELGSVALDGLLGVPAYDITDVAARGDYLGVAQTKPADGSTEVTSFQMVRAAECGGPTS
jgi:hypothetical protein